MKNVTVSEQEIAEQQEQEEAPIAEQPFKKKKASKRLSEIVNNSGRPSRFEVLKENDVEDVQVNEEEEKETDEKLAEEEPIEEDTPEGGAPKKDAAEDDAEVEEQASVPEEIAGQLQEAFPDKDFSSAEELNTTIGTLIKDSKNLQAEREANKKVYDLFDNTPEMVEIAQKRDAGMSFMEALASTVDIPEAIEEMKEDDPEKYKAILKAQAKREARLEQQAEEKEKAEQAFLDNQEESQENLTAFQKERGMDDSQREAFVTRVGDYFTEIVNGRVTPEFLEVMYKGLNHDADIEQAKEKAKIEGKNEKINAEKRKKAADGLPTVRGGKPRNAKEKPSNGKRAIAGIVSGSRSTFN